VIPHFSNLPPNLEREKKNFIQIIIIIINYFQFNQNSTSSVTPENEKYKIDKKKK
jgi:hypothetical protein